MDFCKQFNAATQQSAGKILPVVITVYSDKSFTFKPMEPSAGPTGGAGLAAPALIWSLMNPVTSFAIIVCYSFVT
jgi:hypothetical protein